MLLHGMVSGRPAIAEHEQIRRHPSGLKKEWNDGGHYLSFVAHRMYATRVSSSTEIQGTLR
jgi:hypothetical protein